jgi:hypothetical protein
LTFSEYTPISKQPRWPFFGEWWIFPNIHHHLIYRRLDMEDLASCGGQQSGKSTIEFSLPCWMTMLSPDKPNWIAGHGSPQIYPPSFSDTKTYYKYTLWSYSPKFSPSHSLGSVKTHVEKYKETDPNRAHMIHPHLEDPTYITDSRVSFKLSVIESYIVGYLNIVK